MKPLCEEWMKLNDVVIGISVVKVSTACAGNLRFIPTTKTTNPVASRQNANKMFGSQFHGFYQNLDMIRCFELLKLK